MHRNWLPHRLGLQKSNGIRSFLFVALMARIDHHGIVRITIYLRLFQVRIFLKLFPAIFFDKILIFSFLILLCCDNATYKFRSVMVPIHSIFGIITFMLAIATALTGFLQKARFDLGSDYNLFAEEGIIVNTIGVVLIGLGCIVPFAVRRANSPANSRVYVTERL